MIYNIINVIYDSTNILHRVIVLYLGDSRREIIFAIEWLDKFKLRWISSLPAG